jgi:hemerythrin-like domain-containing protein
VSGEVFHACTSIVRKFVEDNHEKLEEKFIFPEFEKRNKLVELVKTLRTQHDAGRSLTDVILRNSEPDRFGNEESRRGLVRACRAFIRLYRPHKAREDAVLFPALHMLVTSKQLNDLGDDFEKEEDRLFGEAGFEKTVDQVAGIEKGLGLYELSQFTPETSK